MKDFRNIAIYLPQYHPMPLNDEAWGKGFTEWTNVAKARPRYPNHYQPQIPADLGFYDLRLEASRLAQAEMAKEYGIDGFCYYHYWFTGKQIMETPFNAVLSSGKPNFPFMLCWANENWTKTWEGKSDELLISQDYSEEDDRKHIKELIPAFKDKRYIKIDGKPVFMIYKSTNIPDPKRTIDIFREEAYKEGLELYLIRVESYNICGAKYLKCGFDAAMEFQPQCMHGYGKTKKRILYASNKMLKYLTGEYRIPSVFSYKKYSKYISKQPIANYKQYPCVMPGWDNSPRKGKKVFFGFYGNTPALFKDWLLATYKKFSPYSKEENLIFLNAWNEWAEGNHLEPDIKWGRKFLEAIVEAQTEYEIIKNTHV